METTLYLPYYDYNDGAFDVSNNYYDSNEYAKKMKEEYDKSKDVVYNSIQDFKNGSQDVFGGGGEQTYMFGQKTSQKQDKIAYSSCEGVMYNTDGKDYTVDDIITRFAKQESFMCILELNMDTSEEEFETEFSLWMKEHTNINKYKEKSGEEWAWVNEPKRNIKIKFQNNADETILAILENCKIVDKADYGTYVVYVERIRLIDEI